MKRERTAEERSPFSLPATCGFVLLAVGFMIGCALIVGSMLKKPPVEQPETVLQPSAEPAREESSEAAAMLVPEDGRLPTPSALPEESPPEETPGPQPTPTPTPMPAVDAPAFSQERMDFAVLGFDGERRADALCIVSLTGESCTVLSLPRNTLTAGKTTLGDATTAPGALAGMRTVFPVRLKHYVTLDMAGLADCVDAFGGVTLGGEMRSGAETADYLAAGGSDELLRITRQQTLLHALTARMQQIGLLRMLSAKYTLQKHTGGSFSAGQYIELYGALRRLDTADIRFLTLPVDSVVRDGRRYYEADRPLSEALARELFMTGE